MPLLGKGVVRKAMDALGKSRQAMLQKLELRREKLLAQVVISKNFASALSLINTDNTVSATNEIDAYLAQVGNFANTASNWLTKHKTEDGSGTDDSQKERRILSVIESSQNLCNRFEDNRDPVYFHEVSGADINNVRFALSRLEDVYSSSPIIANRRGREDLKSLITTNKFDQILTDDDLFEAFKVYANRPRVEMLVAVISKPIFDAIDENAITDLNTITGDDALKELVGEYGPRNAYNIEENDNKILYLHYFGTADNDGIKRYETHKFGKTQVRELDVRAFRSAISSSKAGMRQMVGDKRHYQNFVESDEFASYLDAKYPI